VIHSNPVGVHYTAQFTCLVVNDSKPEEKLWTSTHLENFVAKGTDFTADDVSIILNEEGNEYTIKSIVNDDSLVELKITRESLGFKIGENGTSLYGEDLANPWGSMRHAFWPRAKATGKIVARGTQLAISGHSMYVMALQGMKPHHAAARWNFLNFQGPTLSAVVMQFTTPPSYGEQTSSIGAITKDNKLVASAVGVVVEHSESEVDDVGWPAPTKIVFKLTGPKIEAPDEDIETQSVTATISGSLDHLVDRVDVMAEIPSFVKRVVSGVSGARPYIYQYSNMLKMSVVIDGKEYEEEGHAFSEATFIS
jgi:hypothetical protein